LERLREARILRATPRMRGSVVVSSYGILSCRAPKLYPLRVLVAV
jgi:hypothetical protein